MRDNQAKIVYVGKAKDLRKRVASYFRNRALAPKLVSLLSIVQQIDYIPTDSERESLLLEQKLIRRLQPLYNTMWRDDKSYPYLKLTWNEDYPRLILTRQKKTDGGKYFGPYPNVSIIRKLLRKLWRKKIFPLRPCKYAFNQKELSREGGLKVSQPALYKKVQSCIYLHTGECPAPCVGRISQNDYRKIADKAELFFRGKTQPLRTELDHEMKTAAKKLDYEKAAQIRDQLSALAHISEKVILKKINEEAIAEQMQTSRGITELQERLRLPAPPMRIEAFDISNIQGTDAVGSLVVFEKGVPKKSEYRKFKIKTVTGQDDFSMMAEVVDRRYRRVLEEGKKVPNLVLVDGGKGQLSAAVKALQTLSKENKSNALLQMPVAALAKEQEEIFLPQQAEPIRLPQDSPALHILQWIRDEAHRFAITFHRQRRRKEALR